MAVEEYAGQKWEEARPLNGTQEEVEALWDKLIATRAAGKKARREKQKAAALPPPATAVEGEVEGKSSSENSPTNSTEPKLQRELVEKVGAKRAVQDFSQPEKAQAKRAKDMAPTNADKKIWASLFTSSHGKQAVETYSCRSTSGRGWM